jgi:A/G-specific adenine glycosylase
MHEFAARLVRWHAHHGRHDLPWQNTRDPYCIWLSEIMLQQTQVATVIPYYRRFLLRFPDLAALAAAPVAEVMTLWSGLGYYARARNLHRCAQTLVSRHGGAFPSEVDTIAELPGVGRSTAAAIAAFAHGTRAAILDGNVKRVLCRTHGVEGFPGNKRVEKRLWQLAESLLPPARTDIYTQALMDLGATVCTRFHAACKRCPLSDDCVALRSGRVAELPSPRPKRSLPTRNSTVLILLSDDQVLLERRPPSGIWGGLLALPELEASTTPLDALVLKRFACRLEAAEALSSLSHSFTHFRLEIRPLLCRVSPSGQQVHESTCHWLPLRRAADYALPAPVKTLLQRVAGHSVPTRSEPLA